MIGYGKLLRFLIQTPTLISGSESDDDDDDESGDEDDDSDASISSEMLRKKRKNFEKVQKRRLKMLRQKRGRIADHD